MSEDDGMHPIVEALPGKAIQIFSIDPLMLMAPEGALSFKTMPGYLSKHVGMDMKGCPIYQVFGDNSLSGAPSSGRIDGAVILPKEWTLSRWDHFRWWLSDFHFHLPLCRRGHQYGH